MARKTIEKKTNRDHDRTKTMVVVLACVVLAALIALGIVVYIKRDKIFGNNPETVATANDDSGDDEDNAKVKQYEGVNPNKLEYLTGVISSAEVTNGELAVNVMIDQMLDNSGKCEFTLTHDSGTTLTGSSAAETGPSTSFCSYAISSSGLKTGKYKINVKITTTEKEGVITGEVNV